MHRARFGTDVSPPVRCASSRAWRQAIPPALFWGCQEQWLLEVAVEDREPLPHVGRGSDLVSTEVRADPRADTPDKSQEIPHFPHNT